MPSVIGIDLGTTNSVVAFLDGERPEVIPNAQGQKLTPSVVLYDEEEGVLVGELARRQQINKPSQTVRSIKRFMGRRYSEAGDCLLGLNYQVEADEEDRAVIALGDRRLRPEEISAEILKNIKKTAETFLGEVVTQAVITVPAHFNDSQRQATKEAGALAGLDVLRIINEPTAAALAYGINKGKSETVAVFDFGGGTFDITILEVSEDLFEVLSTNGDTALGGDDVDQILYEYLCTQIQEQTGLDPTGDPSARQRIREAAQQAKCELSTMQKAAIHLPFIVSDGQEPKHYSGGLTRDQFEKMIVPLLKRLLPPCKQALEDAGLPPEKIDTILLVGGSTRIPAVQLLVQDLFGKEPSKGVNPDETVAMGAAVQAGVITGSLQEVLLLDVTPLSLGIELAGGIFSTLIPRNSNVPISLEKTFTTVVDNQKAVQVHVLQGERKMAGENRTLAHFRLAGITAAPREVPEIAVKFHIDANGILDVTATDITSGSSKEVSVVSSLTAASPEDIERVIKESQEKADEDREFLKIQRRIMQAERNSQMMETFIERQFDDLGEETAKLVRERMLRLDIAIQQRDLDAIANAEAELLAIGERHADLYYAHKSSFET